MNNRKYLTTLLCSSALVASPLYTAFAQDADTPEVVNPQTDLVANNSDTDDNKDTIIVTGSRIKKNTFSNAVPIDVLTVEDATLEGISDVGSLLQTATIASGSAQITAATSAQFVQNGGVGASTISLRGLGANRTLSLVNGRRAGPSGTRGSVSSFDLNTLPAVAIERVEILKDGASSIYGSDAVAGVVNFILRTDDYKGVDGFVSLPEQSGGEELRFSGTWGETFDKGRVRLTADYYKQVEMARGDRDYYDCAANYVFNADGSGRRADVIDPRTNEPQCIDLLWGHVWVYDYGSGNVPPTFPFLAQYDYDGSLAANGLSPYPNQGGNGGANIATPNNWYPIYYDQNDISGLPDWAGITVGTEARGLVNGDHPFQDRQSLIPEVERITLMGSGEFEFSNQVEAYAEALYNRRVTKQNSYRQFWTYVYGENAFGAVNTTPTAQGWTGGAQWYSPTAITEFSDTKIEIDYFRLVGGLRGDFGPSFGKFLDGWSWDAHVQYSDNDGDYTNDFIRNDSIQDNWFALSSCVGTTSSVAGLPCVDIPWFDPQFLAGNIDQASRDFLFTTETGNTKYTQLSAEAYVAGPIFKVPAGEVSGAFGVQYIRDEINDVPSDIVRAGNAWGTSTAGITAGVQKTKAIYGEVDIPLVKDKPLMENLEVKASARYTDVNTFGDGTTYKVGANWQIFPSFRLRGNYGTSFRTPALFELFLANQTSSTSLRGSDPCVNWATTLANGTISQQVANNCQTEGIPGNFTGGAITTTIITGGGVGFLDAETSDNLSVGAVWSPEFADLQIALDYFNIEVKDEVAQLGPSTIMNDCYQSANFPNEPTCALIMRNPANGPDPFRIATLRDSYINVNSQINEGVDLTVKYNHETPWGNLRVDGQATYQITDETQLLAQGAVQDFNGESGEPKLTGFLRFNYDMDGPWEFLYRLDHVGRTSNAKRFNRLGGQQTLYGVPVLYKLHTEAVTYHTISATREFGETMKITAGIRNLFDEEPPNVSSGGASNGQASRVGTTDFSSNFDTIGRRVFVNITKTF